MPPSPDCLRLPSADISEGGPKRNLGTEALSRAEPEVRIHLPPADSLSLSRSRLRKVENPGVPRGCARLAWRPGRQRRARYFDIAQPATISLVGHIPVPQCG